MGNDLQFEEEIMVNTCMLLLHIMHHVCRVDQTLVWLKGSFLTRQDLSMSSKSIHM